MNTGGFPYLTLRWLTAGSTCAHIQSSTEKCGDIWWPWRCCIRTTVHTSSMDHEQSCTHTLSIPFFFFFFLHMGTKLHTPDRNLKLELAGYIYRNLYCMCCVPCVVSIISLIRTPSHSHSLLFSLADPISAVLSYREVMMRNGVIMPVVKPQAAQQMCFRDPAFVSEWIRSLLW